MMQINCNISTRGENKIRYIVIHDTGNKSKGADTKAHFNYFNSEYRGSSADCFVDDNGPLWVNDYTKFYTWHCGDGQGKFGITNKNSIGIELCVNEGSDRLKAMEFLVCEVVKTAERLNIPFENIVRHYDASRKVCPGSMSANDWEEWKLFKIEVKRRMSKAEFKDIKGHYAEKHINKLLGYGIVNGDGKGKFHPDDTLTRADAAIMIANALTILGK
ncbi:MAG: N-acetylmuramoyl-L-alanine amidase [Clostridia bacterium]|nr:N-acetylmuramoyl-L-alanine amidase [Clostridia bacterium]